MIDVTLIDSSGLREAGALARRYWNTFERDPAMGRAVAGGNEVVIVEAEALAITLPKVLNDLLGSAGAELSIYGFGKSYGLAAAEHFGGWARAHGAAEKSAGCGALFWPMHIGLASRITVLETHSEPHLLLLVDIAHGALSEARLKAGLDTRPARMLVSGVVSGALTQKFGQPLDARELFSDGSSYRVVVAPPTALAHDLTDPKLSAPASSFSGAVVIEA
jgi:hypothetical protein